MSLNLKNPEIHAKAKQLAALTGKSMTQSILEAIDGRIIQLSGESRPGFDVKRYKRAMEIARSMREKLNGDTLDVDALLYDPETGLPK